MSYLGISVKEAVANINNIWFLPAIQRPYVWGSRYENEDYICKLFDSILKGYPIGGLIVWDTGEEIPYREFIQDYMPEESSKIVDKGLHSRKNKGLIYDGQQRLQTLFSCLRYTFNGRVLVFDLLYKEDGVDFETIGFSFVKKNSYVNWNVVRINELFAKESSPEEKYDFKEKIKKGKGQECSEEEKKLIDINIDKLWDTYVSKEKNSLAYFKISDSNERKVNEIFERLNTGGMALSQADLLLSKIKAKYSDYEEDLQACSKDIFSITGNGYFFSAYSILQLAFLIIKNSTRIDTKKISNDEIQLFKEVWEKLEQPLISFFNDYIWEQFKINKESIIPRPLAILPIAIYFYEIYSKGKSFKDISSSNLSKINNYFIKSQINDWNLASFIDGFAKIIKEKANKSASIFDFPLSDIEEFVNRKGNRSLKIRRDVFQGYTWFGLKILMPHRTFQFAPEMHRRFNPEIDHIFPQKLENPPLGYSDWVDTIWNKQPTKGGTNRHKTNLHPKMFFTDQAKDKNREEIKGSKHTDEYDFFPLNEANQIDFDTSLWENPILFIKSRQEKMIHFLKQKYDIELIENEV